MEPTAMDADGFPQKASSPPAASAGDKVVDVESAADATDCEGAGAADNEAGGTWAPSGAAGCWEAMDILPPAGAAVDDAADVVTPARAAGDEVADVVTPAGAAAHEGADNLLHANPWVGENAWEGEYAERRAAPGPSAPDEHRRVALPCGCDERAKVVINYGTVQKRYAFYCASTAQEATWSGDGAAAASPAARLEAACGAACVSGEARGRLLPQLDVLATRHLKVDAMWGDGGPAERFEDASPADFAAVRGSVSCLYLGDGVNPDRVDGLLRGKFTGVRRLTLAATDVSGLIAVAGLESLVHLQLNFCGRDVVTSLPEVLATLPGLRRLALIGCQGLDDSFFQNLATSAGLLETVEIETHKSPSEPLCENATACLASMPFLTTLRLLGEVQSFFNNTHCFEAGEARLMALDITATELLCMGTPDDISGLRAASRRLHYALKSLKDLRFLRLDGKVYPNYLPALGALGMLQVVDLAINPHEQAYGLVRKMGFATFLEEENKRSRDDDLENWMIGTCDTLRLHIPVLFTRQLADVRQGFEGLRCLDLAWNTCFLINNGSDVKGYVVARILCNFMNLEVLRISLCLGSAEDVRANPALVREASMLAPDLMFVGALGLAPSLRSLHIDILDLTEYVDPQDETAYCPCAAGLDLGRNLAKLRRLEEFAVTCPLAKGGFVKPDDWRSVESTAADYLRETDQHIESTKDLEHLRGSVGRKIALRNAFPVAGAASASSREQMTSVFSDWSTLFNQGGVPDF